MVPVARRNLLADKVRLMISVGGVTFAVLLILVLGSVYRGFERETGAFAEHVPGHLWIMEQDVRDLFHSSSMVPEDAAGQVAAVEGVSAVLPVYAKRGTVVHNGEAYDTFLVGFDVPPGTEAVSGLTAPAPGEIVMDQVLARKMRLDVGDQVEVRGRPLTVAAVGSVSNVGSTQFSMMSWEDMQSALAVPGYVNYVLASVEDGADPHAVAEAIGRQIPGVKASTKAEFAEVNRAEIRETFLPVLAVLLAVAFMVGTALVGLTTYTATIERTREYGVLKAVGASAGHLFRVVLTQSMAVGVAGFLLGVPLTFAVNAAAEATVPEFVAILRWQDVIIVLAASLAMAALGSLIPVRRVATIDPASVFRA